MLVAKTPEDARKLLNHPTVKNWHNYIENNATTSKTSILLLVPCANKKPYTEGETESFFYRWLWKFIKKNNLRDCIFICTVSEPLAIVPEKDYGDMPDYNVPPNIIKKDEDVLSLYINKLSPIITKFLQRNKENHKSVLAYVRPDSTHNMFLEGASNFFDYDLIKFVINNDVFQEMKSAHKRTWGLNWMIFLEEKLLDAIKYCQSM